MRWMGRGEGEGVEGIILQEKLTLNVGLIFMVFEYNHVVEQILLEYLDTNVLT